MDKFIVNIIHRPEMVPEYSATVTGQGKEEDIGDKKLITESLDIFKTQQRLAHEAGLKTTIQMTYASLFNDEAVELAKRFGGDTSGSFVNGILGKIASAEEQKTEEDRQTENVESEA